MLITDSKMNTCYYPMYYAWDYLPYVHFGVNKL